MEGIFACLEARSIGIDLFEVELQLSVLLAGDVDILAFEYVRIAFPGVMLVGLFFETELT